MKNAKNPEYRPTARLGELGVNIVSDVVNSLLGWIFRRTHQEHDFGVDGYIDVVDDEGMVNGRQIAIQIKCGESYITEKVPGFLKYRGEQKHLNYLLNHPMPVLLVVCDPDTRTAYWQQLVADNIITRALHWDVEIPMHQIFSVESKSALSEIAGVPTDKATELEAYLKTNQILDDTAQVLFSISREAIESNRMSGVVEFFRRLSRNKLAAQKNQNKISLHIYGYDDDPRELWEIPEVCLWFREAEPLVKYWIYFLTIAGKHNSVRLLAFCICGVSSGERVLDEDGDTKIKVDFKPELLNKFVIRQFEWLNELTEKLKISRQTNMDVSFGLLRALGMPEDVISQIKPD